jgi:stage IV sporulation protein FB
MGRFQLAGVPVEIRNDFLIITLLLALGRLSTPVLMVEWFVVVFVSILVHELGHAIAFRAFGHAPRIELNGMGGLTFPTPGLPLSHGRSIVVSLAGPGAGFVFGGLVLLLDAFVLPPQSSRVIEQAIADLKWVNIGWGFVNLLPIVPLDGGHVVQSVLRQRMLRSDADALALKITVATAALGVAVALSQSMTWAALMAAYFGFTAFRNLREA